MREAVVVPVEKLLKRLNEADVREAVREEILRQASETRASDQQSRDSLTETQKRLENRLGRLEDSYLDADISRDRYIPKRDEILAQLVEVNANLASVPKVVAPNIDGLIAIAETIAVEDLDDQAWREIVEDMVEKIVVSSGEGDDPKAPAKVRVVWKPEYETLIRQSAERNSDD